MSAHQLPLNVLWPGLSSVVFGYLRPQNKIRYRNFLNTWFKTLEIGRAPALLHSRLAGKTIPISAMRNRNTLRAWMEYELGQLIWPKGSVKCQKPWLWGKYMWSFIHGMSLLYTAPQKRAFVSLLNKFADVLPCGSCRQHFRTRLKHSKRMIDSVKDKRSFVAVVNLLHDDVNQHVSHRNTTTAAPPSDRFKDILPWMKRVGRIPR